MSYVLALQPYNIPCIAPIIVSFPDPKHMHHDKGVWWQYNILIGPMALICLEFGTAIQNLANINYFTFVLVK